MRNGRNHGRSAHRGAVMASLARARPARLDADTAIRGNWPDATEIIDAAGLADDGQACFQAVTRREARGLRAGRLAHSDRRKLVGATASAAVTAIVIVIAVVTGAVVLGAPHRGTPGPGHSTVGPLATPLAFHSLPLGAQWSGRVAYATRDGVVFLAGSVRTSSLPGVRDALAMLPPQARPARPIEIVTSFGLGWQGPYQVPEVGSIKVTASGLISVVASSSRFANRVTFVSLEGVSFPIGSG